MKKVKVVLFTVLLATGLVLLNSTQSYSRIVCDDGLLDVESPEYCLVGQGTTCKLCHQ